MTFAEKLLKLRRREGMSQEELAGRLEVSRQAVSRWETGSAMPEAAKLFQISRIFGVTADYLLDDAAESWRENCAPATPLRKKNRRAGMIAGSITACVGAVGLLLLLIDLIRGRGGREGGRGVAAEEANVKFSRRPPQELLTLNAFATTSC